MEERMDIDNEFVSLPIELWVMIFNVKLLDKRDLIFLSIVCKAFQYYCHHKTDLYKRAAWPLRNYTQPKKQCEFYRAPQSITAIAQLRNDTIGCGMKNGTVHVLNHKGELVSVLKGEDNNPIIALLQHSEGQILTATSECFSVYDESTQLKNKISDLSNIVAIGELPNKKIVIAASCGLIYHYDLKSGYNYCADNSDDGIRSLTVLSNGTLVTGGAKGYLTFWEQTLSFWGQERYQRFPVHSQAICHIRQLDENTLITSSLDGEIIKFNLKTRTHEWFKSIPGINTMVELNDDLIGLGLIRAIAILDISKDEVKYISMGLENSESVTALLKMDTGELLVVTNEYVYLKRFDFLEHDNDCSLGMEF